MLFLAVFCGFMAEWRLEHIIEHSREKEFINSMTEDARIDISNIESVSKNNERNLLYIDSLAIACYNYELGKTNEYEIYRLYRFLLASVEVLKPTERTLMQLKNSGGMRLIRNKPSADMIIFYDGFENNVKGQQDVSQNAQLLNHDKIEITKFANRIAIYGGVLNKYNLDLKEMNENAVKLINTLQEEYQLTEE